MLLMCQISLPIDVLDYIFSLLESDFVTLEACSLSHPLLAPCAERYLYATINLHDGGFIGCRALRMFEFNKLLLEKPRIGSCVRTVEVQIPHMPQFHATDLPDISSILQKLSLVKKITLIEQARRGDLSWDILPETFRQAFLKCLCLQSMEKLSLAYMNFPLSALKDCKSIKTLTLRRWEHDPKLKAPQDTLVHPLPPIEALSIHSCERKSLQKMLPWLKKRNIRSVSISTGLSSKRSFDVLSNILAQCSNHLTTLDLDIGGRFQSFYNLRTKEDKNGDKIPITLSALPHLEKLTVRGLVSFHLLHSSESMWTSIPAITDLLKTSASLKCVSLVLLWYIKSSTTFSLELVSWAPLVRLFVESSVPSFRLHIKTTEECDEISRTVILTSLATCAELMKLVNKGVLVITPQKSHSGF